MRSREVTTKQLFGACALMALVALWGCDDSKKTEPESAAAELAKKEEKKDDPAKAEAKPDENKEEAKAAATEEAKPEEKAEPKEETKTDETAAAEAKKEVKAGGKSTPKATAKEASKPAPDKPAPDKPASGKPAADKTAEYTGPDPCRKKSFSFGGVRHACQTGGLKKAKSVMKFYVKKGKEKGRKFKCTTCHTSTKTYENKPNAVKDLKWILAK